MNHRVVKEQQLLLIVVVYNIKISDLNIINQNNFVKDKSIDIFIYDNSKDPQSITDIDQMNLFYVHNSENPGVSKAYNAGIQKAKELNKKCVLLLDQDTEFNLSLLEEYTSLYEKYGDGYIYAPIICNQLCTKIYSPSIINRFIGKVQKIENFIYSEIYDIKNKSLINSGMMIPIKIVDTVGVFNENIQLDFSDYYFVEKYKHFNSNIILINEKISHSLSGDEQKYFSKEMHRYIYYCIGAKELSKSLNVSTHFAVVRRMIRLIIKYRHIKPITIFFLYYMKDNQL
ncbi:MAG: GT2 family glycosyltransferase [Sulfurimonas sp.]|jgi:GT2 family glycosyltransferase|uniref:glycosyltransferase n=1 Tax=Sulfurimonas sp. TaxID=2022749 RepID=UPI0039E5F0AC